MKMRFNPTWFVLVGVAVSMAGFVYAPEHRSMFLIVICMGGVFLSLNVAMWFRNLKNPPPLPNQAVRLLLKRCMDGEDPDEWAIVEFTPGVSLREARREVGNDSYTQENRVQSFMTKFNMLAGTRPSSAIFYSANRGVAVAKVGPVKEIVKIHGAWKLDTWYCLVGALRQKQMDVESLDGSQTIPFG